jgi:catechol 2,3-dioxygenase-like lactoylglutathione lyase family enzyme
MLHHLSIAVSNLARSAAFYDAVLGTLGYRRVWSSEHEIGYGSRDGAPGPRPHYGPAYYAAFAIDPDGYHVEAVINR